MNLARFGLVIDPGPAQAGAKATITAARSIKPALEDVSRAATQSGKGFNAMSAAGQSAGVRVSGSMRQAQTATNAAAGAANSAGGAFEGLVGKVMGLVSGLALAYAGFKLMQGAFGLLSSSIEKASEMEGFRLRWAFFLGSFDKAREKMAELQRFADNTPFELAGVTTAALQLSKIKGAGMDGAEGLKLVGDAAALAQQPIEEISSRIARLMNNLKRGAGGGDEVRALSEWGIFSPELAGRIMDLGQDAKNFKTLITEIKGELGQAGGAMELFAQTWTGLTSTMGDAWNSVKRAIGEPIMEGLKPLIKDITTMLTEMESKIRGIGPQIRDAASQISVAFRVLRTEGGFQLALTAGWEALQELMGRTWAAMKITLKSVFDVAAYHLQQKLSDPGFWAGVGEAIASAMGMALEAAAPAFKKAADFWGGGTGRAEEQLGQEKLRLEQTRLINARVNAAAAASPGLPVAGQEFGTDLPGGKPGNDLTGSFLDDKPPEYVDFKLAEQKATESMGLFGKLWENQNKLIQDQLNQAGPSAEKRLGEMMAEKDKLNAAQGGASLFPKAMDDRENDPVKDALFPGTDLPYKSADNEAKSLTEGVMTPEETAAKEIATINSLRDANLLSEETKQRAIIKTKETQAEAIASMQEKQKSAFEAQQTQLQKLMSNWGNLKARIDEASVQIMQAVSENITGAIVSMIDGTKSAGEAFADMAKQIVASILQIVIKLMVQYALMAAMGMAGGISFGAFATKSLTAGVKHDGGEVGGAGPTRSVPAAVFAGARKYHSGGMISSNEVPIIAEQGETVLTRDQAAGIKARLSGTAQTTQPAQQGVTILNVQNPQEVEAHLASNPHIILNVIAKNAPAMRKILGRS